MNDADMATEQLKVTVPLLKKDKKRFEGIVSSRCLIKGQLLKKMILAWMDPKTGPIIENALRSLPIETKK